MEEQADYITKANEMLGKGYEQPSVEIEKERTVIERKRGELKEVDRPAFVKIYTSFKDELKDLDPKSLKVWLFIALSINRNTEKANPGLRTIAKWLGMGVNTVQECLKDLEEKNLLIVDRKSRKYNLYETPEYVSANKNDPRTVSGSDTVAETVSERDTTVSENAQTVSDIRIHNQSNQSNQKRGDLLDGILELTMKPKGVRDAITKFFRLSPNWEAKYNRQFLEWSTQVEMTPEQVKQAAEVWKSDRRFNWAAPTLRKIQEHWLELIDTVEAENNVEMVRLL